MIQSKMKKPETVEEYIAGFPKPAQEKLEKMKSIIKKVAPNAEEAISYGMPGYKLNGILVYFAGYEKHIGFYPMPSTLLAFKDKIAGYKNAKGSVQFPLDKPLPVTLITQMVKFRVANLMETAALKKK